MRTIATAIALVVIGVCVVPSADAGFFDKLKEKAGELADQEANKAWGGNAKSQPKQPVATNYNTSPALVREAQAELKRLGYNVTVDGAYGPGTRTAITQFQGNTGRPQTGDVTPELVTALHKAEAESGASNVTQQVSAGKQSGQSSAPKSGTAEAPTSAKKNAQAKAAMPEYLPLQFFQTDLLQLKLRPEWYGEESFYDYTKTLIILDQHLIGEIAKTEERAATYRKLSAETGNQFNKKKFSDEAKKISGQAEKLRSQMYFRRDQVFERNGDFIYKSLAKEVHRRVMSAAKLALTKFHAYDGISISNLEYDFNREVIFAKQLEPKQFYAFTRPNIGPWEARPTLGRYLYRLAGTRIDRENPLLKTKNWERIQRDIPRNSQRGGLRLPVGGIRQYALSERLVIKAISEPPERAEQLLRKMVYIKGQESLPTWGGYHLSIFGEVTDIGKDPVNNQNVLLTRIDKVVLVDQFGNVSRTFASADFPSAEKDFAELRSAKEAKKAEQLKAENQKLAVAQMAASQRRQALDHRNRWDIVGLRPGQSVDQAENIIRQRMKVGVVYAAGSHGNHLGSGYDFAKIFVATDSSEAIAVFTASENSDKVLGIYRNILLDKMTPDERAAFEQKVMTTLNKKYAEPHLPNKNVWGGSWADDKDNHRCSHFSIWRMGNNIKKVGPNNSVDTRFSLGRLQSGLSFGEKIQHSDDENSRGSPTLWRDCSPVVRVQVRGNMLESWIFDHSRASAAAADVNQELAQRQQTGTEDDDVGIDF